jgi:putative tricarboxylic transport membrane protein
VGRKISKFLEPELFFYFLILILGVAIVVVSWNYGFGSIKRPGPGLYPFFLGLCIILPLSLALLILGLGSEKSEAIFDRSSLKTFLLMNVFFVFWIISLPFLGYVIATFCATFAFCKIMHLEGWIKPLILSFSTSFLVYLLFDVWLYIDLPRGILGI